RVLFRSNAQWAKPAVIVNRLAWAADGRGPLPQGFTQVYTIDSVLGGTPRQITSGKYNHNTPDWAADGNTIYVSAIRKPDAEYLRGDSEIYAIDLKTLEVKALTTRSGADGNPQVSPDGRWIGRAFTTRWKSRARRTSISSRLTERRGR